MRYREGAPASGLYQVEAVLDIIRSLRTIAGDEMLEAAIGDANEQLP